MTSEKIYIKKIPAIIWGEKSDKVYIFVHGKMSNKESAEHFAEIAEGKGYQTISFDLPEHGERSDENYKCDIWNGMTDLDIIAEYVYQNWNAVSLFGCSLGAFFSLHTYKNRIFEKVLFQSPVVNMEYLIHQMFAWFGVTEEALREKQEIPTPIDMLSWRYYSYVKEHPIEDWSFPTYILFGGKDNLQSTEEMKKFCNHFKCKLTISENSEHPFGAKEDSEIVDQWLLEHV